MLRTRQDIIDAARSLFNSESYDSVTMDEIAEEADLSRATLYNHFDNKESIYYQIGVQYLADLRKSQQKIQQRSGMRLKEPLQICRNDRMEIGRFHKTYYFMNN